MAVPFGNTNAVKWTFKKSVIFFKKALELSKEEETYYVYGKQVKGYRYHFIGEIAAELNIHTKIFSYLSDKFESLKRLDNQLHTRLESNCFSDGKKGIIKDSLAIMNLKANYKWQDRVVNTVEMDYEDLMKPFISQKHSKE